jgi:hypothetical protein
VLLLIHVGAALRRLPIEYQLALDIRGMTRNKETGGHPLARV